MIGCRNKGNRLNTFVADYVSFDFETTDKNINYAEIIEIAAVKVENNTVVDEFRALVKPNFRIPAEATAINGITNEMVEDAPSISDVLPAFIDFIGDAVLLGHNITTYDINLLYDQVESILGYEFQNDYIDTLYLSRSYLPDLENHKLVTVCNFFDVDSENAHSALYDSYMASNCYLCLKEYSKTHAPQKLPCSKNSRRTMISYSDETKALQQLEGFLFGIIADDKLAVEEIIKLKEWIDEHLFLSGNYPFDVIMASLEKVLEDGKIEADELDYLLKLYKQFTAPVESAEHCELSSLENKHCCLTGEFNYGDRNAVSRFIEDNGGIVDSSVKKCTDYVIVGEQGSAAWKQGNYGGKIKKAMELKEKGALIEIISEKDFFSEIK